MSAASGVVGGVTGTNRHGLEPGQSNSAYRKIRSKRPRYAESDTTLIGSKFFHGVVGSLYSRHRPRPSSALVKVRYLERQDHAPQARDRARDAFGQPLTVDVCVSNRRAPRRPIGRIGEQLPHRVGRSIDSVMDPKPSHRITLSLPPGPSRRSGERGQNR